MPRNGECIVPSDPVFQRQGAHALEQFFEGVRREAAEYDEDAFGIPHAEVRARQHIFVARKAHTPVFGGNLFCAERFELLADQTF